MNAVGMTFDEVIEVCNLKPAQNEVRALRRAYRQLMRTGKCNGPVPGKLPIVVNQLTDDDLIKFVHRLSDGLEIESVAVPMHGRDRAWKTLCVSSQVGCARGCAFCETARMGLLRNLNAAEIVGQVVASQQKLDTPIRNVVFMGMGEPFDNFDAVVQAIRVLTDRSGLSFAMERLTLSTVGNVEGIHKLKQLGWRRMNLAVSLNAPNDAIRSQLMPTNLRTPMADLREALLAYPLRKCQYFMIEYVLIPKLNDSESHARELATFLSPLQCVVNVIPYNPRRESSWPAPSEKSIVEFMGWLEAAGQNCKRRQTKGRLQWAGCGQLGNTGTATSLPDRLPPQQAV